MYTYLVTTTIINDGKVEQTTASLMDCVLDNLEGTDYVSRREGAFRLITTTVKLT